MTRLLRLSVVLILALASACAGPRGQRGMIDVAAVEPLILNVVTRHDNYVSSDATLSALERGTYLESSAILLQVLAAARGAPPPPESGTDNQGMPDSAPR